MSAQRTGECGGGYGASCSPNPTLWESRSSTMAAIRVSQEGTVKRHFSQSLIHSAHLYTRISQPATCAPVYLSICIPIYLSGHLCPACMSLESSVPAHLCACLNVHQCACLPVNLHTCLYVSLPTPCTFPPVPMCTHPSVFLHSCSPAQDCAPACLHRHKYLLACLPVCILTYTSVCLHIHACSPSHMLTCPPLHLH